MPDYGIHWDHKGYSRCSRCSSYNTYRRFHDQKEWLIVCDDCKHLWLVTL